METVSAPPKRRIKLSKVVLSWYGVLLAYVIIVGLFLLLRLAGGNDPIALKLGGLTFRWYGVIITCGVIVASFLAQFLAERRNDDPDHVWRILPILLVSGILVARLWYVVFTFDSYKDYIFSVGNPVHAGAIEIWRGGIAIQGAVIGGLIGAAIYAIFYNRRLRQDRTKYKTPFSLWRFADYVAPGLVLAQGIGRWGNFMNNEAYGRETKMPWGIKIPCEYRTTGATPGTVDTTCPGGILPTGQIKDGGISKDALFHPTFFYESLWDYFCFLVLFYCIMKPKTIERRFKVKLRDGDIFLLYWIIYSIGRFFTESLRTDSLYIGGNTSGLRSAQVTAIIGILVAGFILFYRHRQAFPSTQALSMKLAPLAMAAAGPAVATRPVTTTDLPATDETGTGNEPVAEVSPVETVEDADLDEAPIATTEGTEPERPKPDYKARVKPTAAVATTDTEAEPEADDELDSPLPASDEVEVPAVEGLEAPVQEVKEVSAKPASEDLEDSKVAENAEKAEDE